MTKEELQQLSKEQIENIVLSIYEHMDKTASDNKKSADEMGLEEDIGYGVYYSALKTMCNLMNIKVIFALNERRNS